MWTATVLLEPLLLHPLRKESCTVFAGLATLTGLGMPLASEDTGHNERMLSQDCYLYLTEQQSFDWPLIV